MPYFRYSIALPLSLSGETREEIRKICATHDVDYVIQPTSLSNWFVVYISDTSSFKQYMQLGYDVGRAVGLHN